MSVGSSQTTTRVAAYGLGPFIENTPDNASSKVKTFVSMATEPIGCDADPIGKLKAKVKAAADELTGASS